MTIKHQITLFRTILRVFAVVAGVAWGVGLWRRNHRAGAWPFRPTAVVVTPATAELAALGSTVQLSAEVRIRPTGRWRAVKAVARIVVEHDTRLWRIARHYVNDARAAADHSDERRLLYATEGRK